MNGAVPGSKYFVSAGKIDQTTTPDSSPLLKNIGGEESWRVMPRCFSYQAYSFSGSRALKKTPPRPTTRRMSYSLWTHSLQWIHGQFRLRRQGNRRAVPVVRTEESSVVSTAWRFGEMRQVKA